MRESAALLISSAFLVAHSPWARPAAAANQDPALAAGIALVKQGDFEAAVLRLDAAARRLDAEGGRPSESAAAYLYLGVCYLQLDQSILADAKFREAARRDPQLRLDPAQFSPEVIRHFEQARVATAPVEQRTPSGAAASPGTPSGKKRHRAALITGALLVVGGGTALALSAGSSAGSTPTTTIPVGGGTSTTTTSTTSTTTTTTTTTTTLPPACEYQAMADTPSFGVVGGAGTCRVETANACRWSVQSSAPWIVVTGDPSGQGRGSVTFLVAANTGSARSGEVRVTGTSARCQVSQAGVLLRELSEGEWVSHLDVPGATAQVTIDGGGAVYQAAGVQRGRLPAPAGRHRIEATLVKADGRSGTWRFLFSGNHAGPIWHLRGDVLAVTATSIVFRVPGRAGAQVGFAIDTQP